MAEVPGYVGKKGIAVLYHEESTIGDKVTPSRVFGIIEDFTPPTSSRSISTKPGLGTTAPQYYDEDVQLFKGGSIKVKVLRPEFLEYIVGASVDSAGPGPYTHTMGISDIIASLTIGVCNTNVSGTVVNTDYYCGSVIKSVVIEAKKGQPVMATINFDCMSNTSDAVALTYATQTGEAPIIFKGASVKKDSATMDTVTEFTLTMERRVALTTVLGSVIAKMLTAEDFSCNLSLTYAYTATTEKAYFDGTSAGTADTPATERNLVVTVTNGLLTTELRSWVFTLATSKFGEFKYAGFGDHRLASLMAVANKTCAVVCTDNTADWTA
jgi:hypothetical protein